MHQSALKIRRCTHFLRRLSACVRVFSLSGCRFYVNKPLRQFLMRPGSRTEIILISLRQPHIIIGFYVAALLYQTPGVFNWPSPYVKVLTPNQKGAGAHNGPDVGLFQPSFCVLLALSSLLTGRAQNPAPILPPGSVKRFPSPAPKTCLCLLPSCVKTFERISETLKCCQPLFNMFRCARGNIELMNNANFWCLPSSCLLSR